MTSARSVATLVVIVVFLPVLGFAALLSLTWQFARVGWQIGADDLWHAFFPEIEEPVVLTVPPAPLPVVPPVGG